MTLLYNTSAAWAEAPQKNIAVFGMSGLGKTRLAQLLRAGGDWYHYSVDYRIGTAYMGEYIEDNLKSQAMTVPFLADLLRSDSICIRSKIRFENLSPLSTFLGKPGARDKGGLNIDEYMRRQALHRRAEINALLDTPSFIARARDLYTYPHFICDTGGSICEVVNPHDPKDEVLVTLSTHCLLVWIKDPAGYTDELIRRFDRDPKPLYYNPEFLLSLWQRHLDETGLTPDAVDPNTFARVAFTHAMAHRAPLYHAMAENWGVTVQAAEVETVRDAQDVVALIARALAQRDVRA